MGGKEGVRIGIEGKVLTRQIGGIGRCAINLLTSLVSVASQEWPDLEFVIFSSPQTDLTLVKNLNVKACHILQHVRSSILRACFGLPVGAFLERIDIFHGLDESGVPFYCKRGKYVVTIHDVMPLMFPGAFPFKHRLVSRFALSRVCRQADVVIVPSCASKVALLRYVPVDEGRVIVTPWGCEARFHPMRDAASDDLVRRRYGLPDRYLLFVGTLEPRKEVMTLLRAYAQVCAARPALDAKLVIAGGHGWGSNDVRALCESLQLTDRVIFTGFVEEDDLPDLYRGALLFIYPSSYEGFGLPILEAMACGVPVITSNVASMPEVAGQAAILVEPRQPDALATAMAAVLNDPQLRDTMRHMGLERVGQFSWERTARQMLDIYRSLA
jgi:glycosyltransferase involved in cell wall biosynthesis